MFRPRKVIIMPTLENFCIGYTNCICWKREFHNLGSRLKRAASFTTRKKSTVSITRVFIYIWRGSTILYEGAQTV